MGFRFRKRLIIAPGVYINIGKKGVNSVSVGGKGFTVTTSGEKTTTTVGIPGTGISYSSASRSSAAANASQSDQGAPSKRINPWFWGIIGLAVLYILSR